MLEMDLDLVARIFVCVFFALCGAAICIALLCAAWLIIGWKLKRVTNDFQRGENHFQSKNDAESIRRLEEFKIRVMSCEGSDFD